MILHNNVCVQTEQTASGGHMQAVVDEQSVGDWKPPSARAPARPSAPELPDDDLSLDLQRTVDTAGCELEEKQLPCGQHFSKPSSDRPTE
jgi:hypothetical protein